MGDNLVFAVRGSTGLSLKRGLSDSKTFFEENENPKQNACSVFAFSNNGNLFAYCDTQRTRVIDVVSGKEVLTTDLKRTKNIVFSPKDTHMLTFEQYAIYGKRISADQIPDPNLGVWNVAQGKHVVTLIAPKEASWRPQWAQDESIAVRLAGSELLFYPGNNLERFNNKLVVKGMTQYSLSNGSAPYHVACYIPSAGSVPARVQVRKIDAEFTVVANKTFFKSDSAEFIWNARGTALLILTTVDVDKSNQSYYGEQNVCMVNVQRGESFMVPLAKNGPVYSAEWNPNGKEFAICYGFMPAKLTVYDARGEPIFDAAEGPRNEVHYNAFGNILLACGFGNLAKGKMEFWDVEKKKEIISIDVPNTTQFQWAPDGQHFITATTTPRLRIDNCYRVWHYSGRMIAEVPFESPKELWQVMFRPMSSYNKFEVAELSKADQMKAGLLIKKKDVSHPLNNLPAGAVRQAGAYVPPHLRGKRVAAFAPNGEVANAGQPATALKPTGKTEVEKQAANLKRKIRNIGNLKEKLAAGEVLPPNQMEKISGEKALIAELAALSV